jgi:hypothetical protein
MAPIYDTDVAKQRWEQGEWDHYELWEKVEHRLRRYRRIWIGSTVAVFIALSSVPIIMDRSWKWASLGASRHLAQEINRLKKEAGIDHAAYRIRFKGDGSLAYQIEKANSCSDPHTTVVRSGSLVPEEKLAGFTLLNHAHGQGASLPGLVEDLCYDYLSGSDTVLRGDAVAGFGIVPAKDLAEQRMDRLAILLVNGPSAEISFE